MRDARYALLIFALAVWLPLIYLFRGTRGNPLWQALARGLVAGLLFASVTVLLGTSRAFDDWASPRPGMVLLAYSAIHFIVIGVALRGRRLTYVALLAATLVWTELSATVIFLAAWSLLRFGYL